MPVTTKTKTAPAPTPAPEANVGSADLQKMLRGLKTKWATAAEESKSVGTYQRLADGKYMGRLTGAEITMSNGGKPMTVWSYTVVDGDEAGEIHKVFSMMETEQNLKFLCADLARFGYDPTTFSPEKLPAILDELVERKPIVRFRVKTTRNKETEQEYTNTYIEKVYPPEYELDGTDAPVSDDDDDDEAPDAAEAEGEDEAEEEEEEEEEEEDEVELAVGMKVSFTSAKDGDVTGQVLEILSDEEKVRVKGENGKVYKVSVEKLQLED